MPVMIGDDAGAERADRRADRLARRTISRWRCRPLPGGVASSTQACSTARTANRKKPSNATNNTNQPVPPANIMSKITTAVIDMLETMIWRRPIVSDRWPAIGAAMKPAACSANMQAPIHSGE